MQKDPHIPTWKFNWFTAPAFLASLGVFLLSGVGVFIYPNLFMKVLVVLTAMVFGVITYFFRDPSRTSLDEEGLVVSPCDGEVVSIEEFEEENYLGSLVIRISVFLSLFDVHVQRAPLGGEVSLVDHKPGQFLQAFKPEASELNEYIAMRIETEYGRILVKQIAGILARRCMNYAVPGQMVETGQRFGHIKFGSRVDLFLPLGADVKVKVGDKIAGGLTPVAQLKKSDE